MSDICCHGPWGPWFAMGLSYSGHIKSGCCEFKGTPLFVDLSQGLDIPAIWNGSWFQSLRAAIRDGQMREYGCDACTHRRRGTPVEPEKPGGINDTQWANYLQAHKDRLDFKLRTAAVPMMYSICFTPRCNIKCIMCSQQDSREHAGRDEFPAELLMDNVATLSKASTILVSGGEPLVSKECIKFLEFMGTHPDMLGVQTKIVTNGTLLHKVIPLLERKKRVDVQVSLDGMGKTYDYVRKGASWEEVSRNIGLFLDTKAKYGYENWTLGVNCVLMKSTVLGLPDLIRWCREQGLSFNLNPLMGTRESFEEDLVNNPSLMRETPGINAAVEEVKDLLAQPGLEAQLRDFKRYMRSVEKGSDLSVLNIQGAKDFEQFLRSGELKGKRIAIWGTGSNYRYCYADWLKKQGSNVDMVGFVDNNAQLWGGEVDGYPVHSPEELQGLNADYLLLAVQIVWRDEILHQLAALGCSGMKIF